MDSLSLQASSLLVQSSHRQLPAPQKPLELDDTQLGHGKGKDEAQPMTYSTMQYLCRTSQTTSSGFIFNSMPLPYPTYSFRATSDQSSHPLLLQTKSQTSPLYPTPSVNFVESFESWRHHTFAIGSCALCYCKCGVAHSTSEIDFCTNCGHLNREHVFGPGQYEINIGGLKSLCKREKLVKEVLERVQDEKCLIIRSTPMTGKTLLLQLVAKAVLEGPFKFEPVYTRFDFRLRSGDDDCRVVDTHLEQAKWKAFIDNSAHRRSHSILQISLEEQKKRPVLWLIDEATNLYSFPKWWERRIKNSQAQNDYFLLACVHGSAHTVFLKGQLPSQSILVPLHSRVELMPTSENHLSMCFSNEELEEALQHWIENLEVSAGFKPVDIEEGVHALLMLETGGHIGVVTSILNHLRKKDSIQCVQRSGGKWTWKHFRDVIEHEFILRYELSGIYTYELWRLYLRPTLAALDLSMHDFKDAVKKAIFLPDGIIPENFVDQKVYEVCHRFGLLYSEASKKPELKNEEFGQIGEEGALKYLFPSPWHRRWISSQLFQYDTFEEPNYDNLLDFCMEIIRGFSSSALQDQDPGPNSDAPEAAYQNEVYLSACRKKVLLLLELTKPIERGVDFWQFQKQWMIGIIRDATPQNLKEHQSRFGKYWKLGFINDFIIINFISLRVATRSFVKKCQGEDEAIHRNTYHVIWKDKSTAQMWNYTGEYVIETFYFTETEDA